MADGYISQIKLPNEETYDFRDRNLKVYTGSCSTAAGTAIKDVVTDGIFTLEKGAVLFVNFTNTNSAAVGNLKLKINGEADTSAKPIKYLVNGNDPANIPGAGYLRANQTYMFRYDGTNWVADLNYYTYSNDFANKIGHYNNILARKAIAAESLIVGDETGYEKVASGVTFNLAYPIVWCTGAVNANASNYANMFLQHYDRNIATGAKSGFTSAANKVIYLIVTISGNIATIDSNIITDTLPSSDDGKVYISLGKLGAQSTGANYFFLYPVHSMFWYKNGAIREYSGASQYALAAPLSGISGADDLKAIEAIGETTGLLKKTAANTWTLDTSDYVTSSGITSVTIGATSPVQSSTSTAQTGSSASTTISLKDAYGDTKNPYGSKTKNYVLAAPSNANGVPSFRALVAADIPNKIQTNWELNAASGNSPALLFTRDGSLTDWKILVASGKLSFQSATDGSTWTERAYFKDNSGDFVATSFAGKGSDLTDLNASNISSGTLSLARLGNQNANYVLAGPTSGNAAAPSFRTLVTTDIPDLGSIYIKKSAELLTTNPFAPASLKGPYISKIDNAFYAADKRWSVTGTNISSIANLFDGSYESQAVITSGNTAVITMDFDPSHNTISEKNKYFPGYPYGYILISFYNTSAPDSISGKVYCNYQQHGIGWKNITFSPINDNTTSAIVYKSSHQGYYQISVIEITINARSSANTIVTQIEMHLDRPDSHRTPFLSKYGEETLYYNLTAPKFIGALEGVADKSKAANLTSTTNAIAYYTNTTGTFGSKASANGALYATSANGALQWGTLPIAQGGTGKTTANDAANILISGLPAWTANPTDDTYLIRRDTGGTATYGQVKFSTVWNYIKGKADSVYANQTTVNGLLAAADAMIFKGTLGTGGTITAVPDGTSGKTYQTGYTYKVITAGTWAGIVCEVGDLLIATADSTSGQTAVNNAHWTVAQTNIDGAVTGPAAVTSGRDNSIARFNGETGKIIQDSLVTIDDNGHMSFGTEKVINFRMNRKKAEGGSWACSYINWYDNANTLFANIGMYGSNNNFDYLYLGAEAYNSTKNLKILSSGRVRVLSLDFNGTDSYGSETQPIYWKDGVPVACTSYANASVNYATSAGTATTLQNARTLWGQSFDGSANITGNLIDVGNQIKLLSGQTELQFLTSTGGAANGKFGKLGLNTTYANVDFTNYILDVNGKARIGALDGGQHVINGNVQLNAQSGSYNEGLRINRSTTGYANVYLGGTRSSASGNQTGGWWIGTLSTPADATSNGDAITNTVFTISNNNTSDTLSIKGTRGATIGTNSGWAIKPRLAVGTTYNTSYTLYIAGTGYFTNNVNIVTTSTTANTAAYGTLTLGNNANVSSTTAHSEGSLVLYSAATAAHTLRGISTTTAYTHSLPNKTGILVTLDGSPAANIGSETQPVYITKDGVVNACTTYANASVNYATSAGKLSNTTAIGSDVKPVYFTNGGVPQATATEMLRGFTTTSAGTDLNAMYDSGMYSITGGTLTNYPTGGANYATILTVAYRKPSGNTKPDYAWQMGNFTQNTNRMWYRTSQAAAWNEWRQIVNIATNTGVGGTSTPVYIDANGEVLAGTALKALAYKDSLTYSDVGAAAAEHGTHVTTATVQSALGISSSGSTSKALTEKGTFVTFGTSNLTIGNTSSTAMAGNTTVTNVSFTAASDNAEYPILIKNSTGNTTTAAGTKFNTEVTINPSNQTITANEFIGNLKGNNIIPTMQKTYTGNYYGTGDNYDSTSFFFISLRPDTWYKPWKIKFKIHSYCPAHTECDSVTYGLYTGRLGSYSYANWNERNDSYAHYYTSVRTLNQTGFNAGLSHALGICLRYASNYTNTGWPRTFEVEIYDYEGCTVSLLDAPLLWANWPNAANNYNGWSVPDAVTRGLCETNDATSNNDDRTLQDIMYFRFKSGAAGIGRYTLLMEESTGVYSSLTTTFPSSNTPLTTLTMNTGVKYKLGRIIYFNQGANRAGNTNIGNDNQYFTAYSLIDGRYTFQYTAGALTGYKPFYMVGTLDANGFFTIDPAATAWSQDLPTANTNKVYVFLGTVYPDTNAYRIALELDHPIYTFTNGALKQINPGDITGNASTVGGHTVEADVPSDAVFTDTTYTFDGTYNASSNKAATVSTVTNAINALDGTITGSGSTTKTITALSQTNGKVSATFSDIAFPVTSVAGLSGAITASNLTETLGLSKALRFVGVTTTDMTGGTATNHTYTGKPAGISDYTPAVGDVVINSTKQDEWVCTAVSGTTYTWERLGSDTSYKIVQSAVADPTAALTTSTTFIDTISQNTNGVITATKKTLPTASTEIAGIIKIGTAATDAMAGDTNITNVAFTAATDSNEYPILLKNSTGSTTTAASAKFANTSGKMTTINPNTGIITAPGGISAGHLTLTSTSAESHLTFSRTGWNYITMPNNDSSVISIGYGTPADNTTQRLVIYKTGTVRPGANGSQNLGDDTHKWNKVYGVNFYGTFNGTATSAQQLAAREIDNSDLNQFSSGGALKYAWVSGGNNILSKPTNVNAFGVIAMKTAANWTGQILMSTDTEPGLYWRTNLTTETPTYGSWTPLASGNGGVYYGTCATAADVVEKVVVCKHYHTLKAGDIIVVTFTNSNTQAQPKLNVNNTGAVSVKMAYSGGIVDLGSTSQLRFTCTFIYDGTYWLIINQQNAIQLATSSGNVNWRSVLLSDSNSVSENFTPSANTLGRTYAAHNVKYQPSTGTLRAPIMKTPKVQIEYDHVNKAHIQWNDTDSSIDFIFD